MVFVASGVDGLGYNRIQDTTQHPGVLPGQKFLVIGQTVNTVAGNVANQGLGTVALPALAAGATGTVTITDSLITTTSLIFTELGTGTTTPAAGAVAAVHRQVGIPAAGSVVVTLRNLGSAATLATDCTLWYRVVN